MPSPFHETRQGYGSEREPQRFLEQFVAGLRAFARHGYDGVSVRTLTRELGVSHNLIHQRFGSKADLWRAAVDHGFGQMARQMQDVFDPTISDPLEQAKLLIRRFVIFSAEHPELLALMDIEARQDTDRLAYVFDRYVKPTLAGAERLVEHLIPEGKIRPISLRQLHFLVAHGAIAPFTLVPLAERFDPRSPLDPEAVQEHADLVAEVIIGGLRIPPSGHLGRVEAAIR
jgi:TetR/AcrR family transcriptional regulator